MPQTLTDRRSERLDRPPGETMIKTVDLQKSYRTDEVETTALAGLDLEIGPGEFLAVMGPSGCGKSTLLNLLGLLDDPTGGEYYFDGRETSPLSERQRALVRKGAIGFVFQSFNLIEELSVRENVELPLLYLDLPPQERRERVDVALDRVGIAHRRDHRPQQLSGGQQQRVAVARAVVAGPRLILADEPTGNLDSRNGAEIMDLLSGLNEAGTTIIMVTHSPTDAERAETIIHLFDGRRVSGDFMSEHYAAAH
jgi:putative ABC transport system ATP-binding protein